MTKKIFRKVLIANRGEIALRIMRSLKRLDIKSIAIYSNADRKAFFVRNADEAWPLGEGTIGETYLNISKIIEIALQSGADAIHPGYGFLSENPLFAKACEENGLAFIGPSAAAISLMGNKIAARNAAVENGLPVTKGLTGNEAYLLENAAAIPLPILVKAAAGGGGKGMRIVRETSELQDVIKSTSREALNYFGDGTVYIEQFVDEPRHIEIQVLGDHHGNVIHLFERECSIQRRYQKIIEESPSPTITREVRQAMGEAAVKLCKAIGYFSAGTIEFLVDKNMKFYFLEMNTRIQVEHPVTEMVTGIDLIEAQIAIAQGEPLFWRQEDVKQTGHAIECRIYAEDPEADFLPSPGTIHVYKEPSSANLRIDSSLDGPAEVLSFYDPMISKLVAYGHNREEALQKAVFALQEYAIHGIKTNLAFLLALLKQTRFVQNQISTAYCDRELDKIIETIAQEKSKIDRNVLAGAFLLFDLDFHVDKKAQNIWKQLGFWRQHMSIKMMCGETESILEVLQIGDRKIVFKPSEKQYQLEFLKYQEGVMQFQMNGVPYHCIVSRNDVSKVIIQYKGFTFLCSRADRLHISEHEDAASASEDAGNLFAPMPGKVIQINVKEGQQVNRGAVLLVIEAMKMENIIHSPMDAVVEKLTVVVGDMVDTKKQLIHLIASNHN